MSKYKWDNLILFVEQLASASAHNLPLDTTLKIMSQETGDAKWGKAQESVSELVELGSPLSEAMGNYPKYFPNMLRRMVRAGEEGNVLPAMLTAISGYLQSAREIQQRMSKSMVYPFLVWVILMINMLVLFIFVVPKLNEVFSGISGSLPSISQGYFMYGPGYFMYGPGFFVFGGALVFFLAWLVIGAATSDVEGETRLGAHASRLASILPFIGALQRHARGAQVCELLGVLIQGRNSLRDSIDIAKGTINNPLLLSALEDVEAALDIEQGSEMPPRRTLIPHTTLWMLAETQGTPELGNRLLSLSQFHRRQLALQSGFVRDMLEPLMLIAVAVIGAVGIIAIYAPFTEIVS